ncbi:MAG: hypothetical protein ACQETW_02705 [Pseudomonadota bacterium]
MARTQADPEPAARAERRTRHDLASRTGLSDARLLMRELGDGLVRLRPNWDELLPALACLGGKLPGQPEPARHRHTVPFCVCFIE